MLNLYAVAVLILGLILIVTDLTYHLFGFPKMGRELYIRIGKRKIHLHHGYLGAALTIVALLLLTS